MTDAREPDVTARNRLGEILAGRDATLLTEVFAEHVVDRYPAPGQAPGFAGIVDLWSQMFTAFRIRKPPRRSSSRTMITSPW